MPRANHHHETLRRASTRGELTVSSPQVIQQHTFGIVQLAVTAQQKPAQRLWTGQDA
jgi:hypothetical protein